MRVLTNKFHTLCIILGSNCNFRCRYCMQHIGIKKPISNLNNFNRIKQFIIDIAPKKILLWGGEPLLYWEQFKEIVLFCRGVFSNIEITTITNGSLLTQDKVDFINEYSVNIGLSNDAFATVETRYIDILQQPDKFALFKQIKSKGINTVVSAKTQDLYKVWKYYDDLFGEFVNVNFDILKNFKNDIVLGNFNFNRFQETMNNLQQDYVLDILHENYQGRAFLFFSPLMRLANRQNNIHNNNQIAHLKCGTMNTVIVLDFNGNVYKCKNSDCIIGNISDLESAKKNLEKDISIPQWCKGCSYQNICDPTGCVVETEENKKDSCKINKIIYRAFYNALNTVMAISHHERK